MSTWSCACTAIYSVESGSQPHEETEDNNAVRQLPCPSSPLIHWRYHKTRRNACAAINHEFLQIYPETHYCPLPPCRHAWPYSGCNSDPSQQ
eukprot:4915-Eustigmatos_ZCMA.PRE.1